MKSEKIIEKIRHKLKESDSNKRTVVNTFQFNFTDVGGDVIKHYVFDFKDLQIFEGTTANADAQITISDDDFYAIGNKQTSFDELLQKNRVQIEGDSEAINKMMDKFKMNGI